MNIKTEAQARGQALVNGWRNFWFRPQPAYTLGVVRIAFGALMIAWTILLSSDLDTVFGNKGIMPTPPDRAFTWGLFSIYSSDSAILVGWIVLLVASFALMVGWHSRLAAIVVFILILSFERRNPLIFNSGDTVIRIEAMFLALAPSGAALSLDQRRRSGTFWSAQQFRPWALRLIQIQLSIIYLSTVVDKLAGETWQNGTAVGYSLRQPDLQIITPPSWMLHNLLVSNVLTWGTLLVELAIAVLVWNRRWRPWVLAVGVGLHLSISLLLEVGFFSCSMFVLYLAFIPPERAKKIAEGVRKRLNAVRTRFRIRDVATSTDRTDLDVVEPAPLTESVPSHQHPDLSTAQISAALDAIKPIGPPPAGGNVARAQRLAAVPDRGRDGVAEPRHQIDEEPTGRHGRHSRHALS